MKAERGFFVHVLLLALAVAAAVHVWTREATPAASPSEVTVWSGKADDVTRIGYETKKKKVDVEAKSDDAGRYFVGSVEKESRPAAPAADAGAEAAEAPVERTTVAFVSVGAAQKLAEDLAPLKGIRSVGKVGDDRAAEFGLDDPEGTLTVAMGSATHKLTIGAATPGGADRYVRDEGSGEVYVVKGDIVRNLDTADSRLIERDLHEWKDNDVATARVVAADKSRDIVRGSADGKKFWADPEAPAANDETVSNWMTKLDRLRPNEYVLTPLEGAESVVRVEYKAGSKSLGFLEVVKVARGEEKPDYYIVSERTRFHAKVAASLAEQVEQDLASVVR